MNASTDNRDRPVTTSPEGGGSPSTSRRSVIRKLAKASLALLVWGASLWRSTGVALAGCTCNTYACCCLAKPHDPYCIGNCNHYLRSWVCVQGGTMYICYECTDNSNCWTCSVQCSQGAVLT